ncbi:hypothetical protein [Streptomyces sp. NPDC051677]|uniref:hypothetical protein n=1 Tax=Streptomyces sp. NPDC051677 TaxID=3365669 RepID=UPI0037D93D4F
MFSVSLAVFNLNTKAEEKMSQGSIVATVVLPEGGDELLKPVQVEAEYGPALRVHTLAQWRWMGRGPEYIKTTPGKSGRIFYRRSAIEAYLRDQTVSVGAR